MYRPSKYNKHNLTLKVFSDNFNGSTLFTEIEIHGVEDENFSDDGYIIDNILQKTLIIDWEVRDRYFKNGKFKFNTLGQFERKFHKNPPIDLSIQCDYDNTHFLVAWHNDFHPSTKRTVSRLTDSDNEIGTMRETEFFKIYSYNQINDLKQDIKNCIVNELYTFK